MTNIVMMAVTELNHALLDLREAGCHCLAQLLARPHYSRYTKGFSGNPYDHNDNNGGMRS
jgi:hypothetical protein